MSIAMMTRTDLVTRYLDAFNRADWETYKSTLTPESLHIEPGGMELRGPEATVEGLKVFRTAFPDLKGEVVRIVTADRDACVEILWRGTHTGPLALPTGTIPPTGKPIVLHASKVFAFEGERISYSRHYWDMVELLTPLGAIPGAR